MIQPRDDDVLIIQRRNNVPAMPIYDLALFVRALRVAAALGEELDGMVLANTVHGLMVSEEGQD